MKRREVSTRPFDNQRPGTSGLRQKTSVFMQPHYLENFVQAIFDVLVEDGVDLSNETLVVGGDGRYFNKQAVQTILRMAAANGVSEVLVGADGLLSTPATSAVIRRRGACGGMILSASHNPGGPDGDVGLKFNVRNGGPAQAAMTERIFERSKQLTRYYTMSHDDMPLDKPSAMQLDEMRVQVIDPLADYTALMEELFDFDALRALFAKGFTMVFDAMNAVTGPYARRLFEERLGAPAGTVMRGTPLEDFGGHHPDPNLVHAAELVERLYADGGPDFGAASDGDGDRNLILGRKCFVSPGDSLAVIAEHAASIPGYRKGLAGVARSMPTSRAVDRVAEALGIACYETPTGWKFFGNLMDAGLCTLCGEESFGTGSSHIREKDGLWAVLCWLSILATTGKSVQEILEAHWHRFGRSYFQRYDYEALDASAANAMLADVRAQLGGLAGRVFAGSRVVSADDFSYTDPVDRSVTSGQGIRLQLEDGSRVVFRLSGTGTQGATLRLYLERYRTKRWRDDVRDVMAPLAAETAEWLELRGRFGRGAPDVVT